MGAIVNTPSISRRAASCRLAPSICLTVITAELIWAFSECSRVPVEDLAEASAITAKSPMMQAWQSERSGIRTKRTRGNETGKKSPNAKNPQRSHIKQEIHQRKKADPEPFTDGEDSIERKSRRALV